MKRSVAIGMLLLAASLAPTGGLAAEDVSGPAVVGANDQPIHDAARMGSGKDIERILKVNPTMRDVRTQHGSTPLHLAATNPDLSALKALLAAGADVNARDSEGLTPLPTPCRGRARARLGNALAVARWLAARCGAASG